MEDDDALSKGNFEDVNINDDGDMEVLENRRLRYE
jgi:hypothetical protein